MAINQENVKKSCVNFCPYIGICVLEQALIAILISEIIE